MDKTASRRKTFYQGAFNSTSEDRSCSIRLLLQNNVYNMTRNEKFKREHALVTITSLAKYTRSEDLWLAMLSFIASILVEVISRAVTAVEVKSKSVLDHFEAKY